MYWCPVYWYSSRIRMTNIASHWEWYSYAMGWPLVDWQEG